MCDSVLDALDILIDEYNRVGDVFSSCFLSAIRQYYREGGRLSDLTWFNGLSLD